MPVQNLATIQQISKNGTLGITWVNKLGMRACVTEVYTWHKGDTGTFDLRGQHIGCISDVCHGSTCKQTLCRSESTENLRSLHTHTHTHTHAHMQTRVVNGWALGQL